MSKIVMRCAAASQPFGSSGVSTMQSIRGMHRTCWSLSASCVPHWFIKSVPTPVKTLTETFIEVIEGQHLDFKLATAPVGFREEVNEKRYILMTQKKSGALVRIAEKLPALLRGKMRKSSRICDVSACRLDWLSKSPTIIVQCGAPTRGKDLCGDVREHKRTLPSCTHTHIWIARRSCV